jgi:hypothetical protein
MSRASFHCRARASKSSIFCLMIEKSPPAEKICPAPVMIAALTLASRSTSRQISPSSACNAWSVVFMRPFSIVMRRTLACGRSNLSRV